MVAWPAGNISVEATARPSNIINEAMRSINKKLDRIAGNTPESQGPYIR